ncbi:MAG: choice-of-anchor J domain-containing protein [Clostridia bacterium]|nr:choice-of-anchor J domain-containing protein [Clostridia bacterium]
MTKKLLSLIVVAFMVIALLPVGAMAESAAKNTTRSANLPTRDDLEVDGSILLEDFEGNSLNGSWYSVNADGNTATFGEGDDAIDFSEWIWIGVQSWAHSGSNEWASFSYYNDGTNSASFDQDNWLFVEVAIPADAQDVYLSCYAMCLYDSPYADDFGIYAVETADATTDISVWDVLVPMADANTTYTQYTASLDAYAGKTIYVLFRHTGNDDGALFLDDVNIGIAGNPPAPTPEPTPEPNLGDLVQGYYFETRDEVSAWNFVDQDGDGFTWMWNADYPFDGLSEGVAYEGEGIIISESYSNDENYTGTKYAPLTPDNWAISPAVTLPSDTAYVSFYATTFGNYGYEHIAAYVGTTADPANMTEVLAETAVTNCTTSNTNYGKYIIDLAAYAGQTVYVAIRHFNCTDVFIVGVDQVEFWGTGTAAPATHTVTFVDGLTNEVISTVEVEDGADATAPAAPEHEGYTFAGWEGSYTNVTDDVTVTATYTVNSYNLIILYLDENGNRMTSSAVYSIPYGTAYSYPSPEFPHYTADTPVVEGTMGAENATVIVTYVIDKYTVTFVDWNGTVLSEQTVPYNGSATAPADPEREGYTFTGWDVDFTNVTSNLVVTAQYEQNAPSQYLKGDVNCDGIVDSADITLAAAYAMSAASVSAQGVANGDMNGDGVLTAADLSALYSYIQG